MSLLDDVAAAGGTQEQPRRAKGAHPKGWEPGVSWNGRDGVLSTGPLPAAPNGTSEWAELLSTWGLDPATHEVVEPVEYRAWDAAVGAGKVQRFFYYKARVVLRRAGVVDYEELKREIKRYKPKPRPAATGGGAFVWCVADLQIGKDDGDGTEGTVQRYMDGVYAVAARVKELRRSGRKIDTLYVAGLGDCIEHVAGHYAQQGFRVQLNLTQQVRVVRRLLVKGLTVLAPLFDKVVLAAVPGNHGEAVRSDGKSSTDFSDNWDIECFVQAWEILQAGDAFQHVSLLIPQGQELTLTVDMAGTIVTLAHGHQFKRASGGGAMRWWADQAHGMQPAGESTVLLAGHLHHLNVQQGGAKTFIQAPALDGGSDWWRHQTGQDSPPGILTLVVGDGRWSDLAIL